MTMYRAPDEKERIVDDDCWELQLRLVIQEERRILWDRFFSLSREERRERLETYTHRLSRALGHSLRGLSAAQVRAYNFDDCVPYFFALYRDCVLNETYVLVDCKSSFHYRLADIVGDLSPAAHPVEFPQRFSPRRNGIDAYFALVSRQGSPAQWN